MVLESDPDRRRGLDHAASEEDVLAARLEVSARVRMERTMTDAPARIASLRIARGSTAALVSVPR